MGRKSPKAEALIPELGKIVEDAEFDIEYKLPKNKGYTNFSIVEYKGMFTYQLMKTNGVSILGKNPNGGTRKYKSIGGVKKALIDYFNDNVFLFEE